MAAEPIQLSYAQKSKSRRRFLHIFILPLLWLPAGIGSLKYHGDEYIGLVMTNLPAMPLMSLLAQQVKIPTLFFIGITFNSLLMVGLGHLMDRVRVPLWAYAVLMGLAAILILTGMCIPGNIPPITPPPGAQFHPQSLCPAWAGALYLFAVGAIIMGFASGAKRNSPS